jgi:hypothetical protein
MSRHTDSDAGAIGSMIAPEKGGHDAVITDFRVFDIDSQDLPKGYFRSPLFLGTLTAAGLSVMAVSSNEISMQRIQN